MKVGQTYRADFDAQEPTGRQRLFRTEYKVVGKDRIVVGPCPYEVLKIEYSNRFGEGPLIFINTEWYVPSIGSVLAREFRNPHEIRKATSIRQLDDAQ